MKNKFKFFRGYIGTLDIMDGQTYATASLYYPRLDSNNEMERYYAEHFQRVERLDRDVNEQIRLFQATTTVTVNPTLLTKVKIFGTRVKLVLIETWKLEPIGVVVMTLLVSVVTFIGVMKLFGA
jgi:hypothetical protein